MHVGAAVDLHKQGFCCLCVGMCTSCLVWFGTLRCYWPAKDWVMSHDWDRSWESRCRDWITDSTNMISDWKGFVCFFPISSFVFLSMWLRAHIMCAGKSACLCVHVCGCVSLCIFVICALPTICPTLTRQMGPRAHLSFFGPHAESCASSLHVRHLGLWLC